MILAFGPNSTYFFDDGAGNRKYRASPEFSQFLASNEIGTINAVALGEGGAYFLNYTTGGFNHMNAWHDPEDRYQALESWLLRENVAHNRKSVSVSLGTDGSFFAASDQGHRWRRIPEGLCDHYQKFTRLDLFIRQRVNTVDLGVNGTYLGIGVDNTWFWELGNEYPALSEMVGKRGMTNAQFITINPFASNQHVVMFNDKTVHWSIPPLWLQDIQSLVQQYAVTAGVHLPPSPLPRPPMSPTVNITTSGRWRPSWRPGSGSSPPLMTSTAAPPANTFATPVTSSGSGFGWNQPNPVTPPAPATSSGTGFDWNQAMGVTQSALDAYNNSQAGGQVGNAFGNVVDGVQMVNNIASNGLMVGQLVGQMGGAAAACCVM